MMELEIVIVSFATMRSKQAIFKDDADIEGHITAFKCFRAE